VCESSCIARPEKHSWRGRNDTTEYVNKGLELRH
jgi:hypothetical protein